MYINFLRVFLLQSEMNIESVLQLLRSPGTTRHVWSSAPFIWGSKDAIVDVAVSCHQKGFSFSCTRAKTEAEKKREIVWPPHSFISRSEPSHERRTGYDDTLVSTNQNVVYRKMGTNLATKSLVWRNFQRKWWIKRKLNSNKRYWCLDTNVDIVWITKNKGWWSFVKCQLGNMEFKGGRLWKGPEKFGTLS